MFDQIRLRSLLFAAAGVLLTILLTISVVAFFALRQVADAASQMGQGKDVVADILPPPLYIIEAQLTTSELARADSAEQPALIAKLKQLRKDYDDRNTYWQGSDLAPTVRDSLLGAQKQQADDYWKLVDNTFLPAVNHGDAAAIKSAELQLRNAYNAHRSGVDATVATANRYAEETLNGLSRKAELATVLILLISLGGVAGAVVAIAVILAQVSRRVGGEPAVAMEIAQRIAGGNLGRDGDQLRAGSGILGALEAMRQGLLQLVTSVGRDSQVLADAAPRLLERASRAQGTAEQQATAATEIAA